MNADNQADPWAELLALEMRRGPRFDRVYGTCAACGLGATFVSPPLQGQTWAACEACGTRWHVGARIFDELGLDEELQLEIDADTMRTLAPCQDVPTNHVATATSPNRTAMDTSDNLPLENAALRCAARARELDAARQPKPPRPPSAEELAQWAGVLAGEDLTQRARRERTASWFAGYGLYKFPIADEKLSGEECARRLKLGADYLTFLRAQSLGER